VVGRSLPAMSLAALYASRLFSAASLRSLAICRRKEAWMSYTVSGRGRRMLRHWGRVGSTLYTRGAPITT
jgi:hypothetical protein